MSDTPEMGLFGAEPPPVQDGPSLFGNAPAAAVAYAAPAVPTPYRVLARKYRPATLDDLIGQDALVRILRSAFAHNRIAHAFMLTGVRGVGKTTTARIIARAFNCIGADGQGGPTADPCGVCGVCRAILADRHPDVVEMDAASRTGVDDVREIIEATRFRPMEARTKVFIIDEVHMLSRNAFNALLKTLEEPPPHVKFIFATTEIRKVPVTVLSRCQRFDLRRIPLDLLAAHFTNIAALENVAAEEEAIAAIARAADGSVRDGLSLLDQAIAQSAGGAVTMADVAAMLGVADRGQVFDLAEALLSGRVADALEIAARAHEHGVDPRLIVGDLLELTHLLARLKSVPALSKSHDLPEAERVRGGDISARIGMPALGRMWQMLLRGAQEMDISPDPRAALEMILIRLCYVAEMPAPAELIKKIEAEGPGFTPPTGNGGGPGGGAMRAMGGGGSIAAIAAPIAAPRAQLNQFRDVLTLSESTNDVMLHGHLLHSVHLVRFAPPVIELRADRGAPRDLASRLAVMLQKATGERWTIVLSGDAGQATLAEQGRAADAGRREIALKHPLIAAIMTAFPGAKLESLRDPGVDAYGLPLEDEPDMPSFAPEDAAPIDLDDMPEIDE
jgi:DNA polymerase-3 subunit gamma/tau